LCQATRSAGVLRASCARGARQAAAVTCGCWGSTLVLHPADAHSEDRAGAVPCRGAGGDGKLNRPVACAALLAFAGASGEVASAAGSSIDGCGGSDKEKKG